MSTKGTDKRLLKVGEKLKGLRIKKGYSSYEHFAWDHQLSRVGYWKHESGANITLKSLLRILDIHGISLEDFFCIDFEGKAGKSKKYSKR